MIKLNLILIKYLGICVIFNLSFIRQISPTSVLSRRMKVITTIVVIAFIQACATQPKQLSNVSDIAQVSHWNARGKLLIRNNKDKLSGYFFWQQQGEQDFKLVITSFIGTNLMTLTYKDAFTEIKLDGETYTGKDPEQLVYELTQSYIPVKHMASWMLAKAPKEAEATKTKELLTSFTYQDPSLNTWQVAYQSYKTVSSMSLPEKMTINGLNNRIKLTINDWELLAL